MKHRSGETSDCLALLERAYEIAIHLRHFEGQNLLLTNLADYYYENHELKRAVAYGEKRIVLCRKSKNLPQLCNALYRQSNFLHAIDEDEQSKFYELEAREIIAYHNVNKNVFSDEFLLIQKGE